jgi:hypothetical protein
MVIDEEIDVTFMTDLHTFVSFLFVGFELSFHRGAVVASNPDGYTKADPEVSSAIFTCAKVPQANEATCVDV